MKLVTFRLRNDSANKTSPGILTSDGKAVISAASVGNDLLYIIDNYATCAKKLQQLTHNQAIPIEHVELLAPIPRPRKNIFCVGKNYQDHVQEMKGVTGGETPQHPMVFTKASTSVIGHQAKIRSHRQLTQNLDYEVELAVVISKVCYQATSQNAWDYVFGYTIINDISARDLQKRHGQFFLGKSLDTSCPMGPCIVTKDEITNVQGLNLTCKINGELRQNAFVKQMIFDIPTLIATLSAGMTLEPGDIIATGTPSGVGAGFQPPKFLQPGDNIECAISQIGSLENSVE